MTAGEARELTRKATEPSSRQVGFVTELWEDAIRKAAESGRSFARESELDRVRTPIAPVARRAAIEELKRRGFAVRAVETGPNEAEIQVFW